jgi:hypothetical protein
MLALPAHLGDVSRDLGRFFLELFPFCGRDRSVPAPPGPLVYLADGVAALESRLRLIGQYKSCVRIKRDA